ncbi:MAG: hypothetical protein IPJ41_06285 [Phycisphaerales bacterium]|nr:hypothetical protein [Phycisphaerales bacterium]
MRGFVLNSALAACLAGVLAGCAATRPQRSTRLADSDLTQAVLSMRQQLADSRFLQERDDASPEARLVLRRVENLSSDRIPIAEQWSLASRVISDPGMQALLRSKRVVVQLPPEKVALLERGGMEFPDLSPEHEPTNLLEAQIASGTRAGSLAGGRDADIRKDYYLLTFVLEDLQGREVLWQGTAELAREAQGSLVD